MTFMNISIECRVCSTVFTFTASEQHFFAQHQLARPKLCRACRRARKAARLATQAPQPVTYDAAAAARSEVK